MDLWVVDLSHHNAVTDFHAARKAGVIGVIHKATEGTGFVDSMFVSRRLEAEAAGLKWASYHFLKHGNAAEQMVHFLDVVEPEPGERVCIDYEADPNGPEPTINDLHVAVDALHDLDPTLQVTIYGGSLLNEHLGNRYDPLLSGTSLWIAQYNDHGPTWPRATWPLWTLWQYSDGEAGGDPKDVPGITAPHDCNAFNGSRQSCRNWFGPAPLLREFKPPRQPIVVAINVPPGSGPVVVTINGEILMVP